jgi:hypothetical protein
VRAWVETVLAGDAPPEAGDADDGPPAHWVEKVRHAAPQLLARPPGGPVPFVARPPLHPPQVEQRTTAGDRARGVEQRTPAGDRAPDVEPAHGPPEERSRARTVSATTPEPPRRRDEAPREGRVFALRLPKPSPSPSESQPRPAAAEPSSRDEDAPLSRAASQASSEDPSLFPDRQTRTQEPARDESPSLRQARPIPPRKEEGSPYPADAEPASTPARLAWVLPVTLPSSAPPPIPSAEWAQRPAPNAWPELPLEARQDEPDVEDFVRELDRRARLACEQRGA